jgi:hypothetical protein
VPIYIGDPTTSVAMTKWGSLRPDPLNKLLFRGNGKRMLQLVSGLVE